MIPRQPFLTHINLILTIVIVAAMLVSCNNPPAPRPKGYFRLALPEKEYTHFDMNFPYAFDYPVYASVLPNTSEMTEPWWCDVNFPGFKAKLHLSYKPIRDNLSNYINDTHIMVSKLIPKATGIKEDFIRDDENKVYGIIFNIGGSGVASTYQFFVTDSTRHFLRGALYFNVIPNNDSLAPIIDFLKEDIQHMISSLRWK